jgi:predicted DNA-binding transcriptional regulator YafY
MNRIDRVSAILIQLQSKRLVKAREIADRFNISLRTVYRDIKTLDEAGVPVLGEAGMGYSLMEGYRLPPVMFTREEAMAFITAGKMLQQMTDASTSKSYEAALFKIKAVLKHAEKDYVDELDQHIEVLKNQYLPPAGNDAVHLQHILQCIASKTVMDIGYFANESQQYSNRMVEPVGIFYQGSHWYLIAYCRLRSDYRNFRTDRISYINAGSEHFRSTHPSLKSFLAKMKQEKEMHEVIIRADKDVMKYFGEQKYYNGFVSQREADGKIEMFFLTCSLHGFARFFLLFGEYADIVKPAELKETIKKILDDTAERLKCGP